MIFGVSATKDAVVVARTSGNGNSFSISSITSIPLQVGSGEDLAELLRDLAVIFARRGRAASATVALLSSSSGRFKSSVQAIKAEAVAELAAFQTGVRVVKVTASSLKTALGCAKGQKWQHRAVQLFNPNDEHEPWSRGSAGALSAAFKVAGDVPPGRHV
jgi:hypothetical protein